MYIEINSDEIDFSFEWYKLFDIKDFNKIEVPDLIPNFLIERLEIRIMKIISENLLSEQKLLTCIQYKNEYITIKENDGQVIGKKMGVMFFDSAIYFGVKIENNS